MRTKAAKAGRFQIIYSGSGARHIDGVSAATTGPEWGLDHDKINEHGFVPYTAENACSGVTRVRRAARGYMVTFGSDDLDEVRAELARQALYYKVCKTCAAI